MSTHNYSHLLLTVVPKIHTGGEKESLRNGAGKTRCPYVSGLIFIALHNYELKMDPIPQSGT